MTNVSICSDAAYASTLAELRDRSLKPTAVRALVSKLTAILSKDVTAQHPLAADEQVAVIVVLRSGLAMTEAFVASLPEDANTVIYHLGLFREKHTLQPVEYYNKLPPKSPKIKRAFILDPLIATGGTAQAAISILKCVPPGALDFFCERRLTFFAGTGASRACLSTASSRARAASRARRWRGLRAAVSSSAT